MNKGFVVPAFWGRLTRSLQAVAMHEQKRIVARLSRWAVVIALFMLWPVAALADDGLCEGILSPKAQSGAQSGWMHFDTSKTVVCYRTEADLERLNRKLKVGRNCGFLGLFCGGEDGSITQRLGEKIDRIFENAQVLLDMYNCKSKIKIMVYTEQNEVERVYANITSQYKGSPAQKGIVAFYFHKLKTVYVSVDTVTEGILAHELGHSIVDHYFIIRPPTKVAEMLAQYVDKNLDRTCTN